MPKTDQSRRDALKKLAIATGVGAAATTEWAKPVVNGIIVPAHAQTTSGSSSSFNITGSVVAAAGLNYKLSINTVDDLSAATVTLDFGGNGSVAMTYSAANSTSSVEVFLSTGNEVSSPISSGNTYTFVVDGTSYSGTVA